MWVVGAVSLLLLLPLSCGHNGMVGRRGEVTRVGRTEREDSEGKGGGGGGGDRSTEGGGGGGGGGLLLERLPPSRPSPLSEEEGGGGGSGGGGGGEEVVMKPFFDNTTETRVVGGVGRTAFLHCRVCQLGDRAVTWIRKRDLHVLTVGLFTYSTDARYSALHSEGSDTWTLRIASAQLPDSGAYECQVTIEPKMSQKYTLQVVEAAAHLAGPKEIHMVSGSNINLTCHVRGSPEPTQHILWYRGATLVNYSSRGGISVVTDKLTGTSRLVLTRTTPADSGNYTCAPANAEPASVSVYILNGEHPAAIQGGSSRNLQSLPGLLLLASAVSGLHTLTQR